MNSQLVHPSQQQGWAQSSSCRSAEQTLVSITLGAGGPQNRASPSDGLWCPKSADHRAGLQATRESFPSPAGMLLAQQAAFTPHPGFFSLFS